MGTNYYFERISNECPYCFRHDVDEKIHIGKSSGGWCFSLHVIPESGIHDLKDWLELFEQSGTRIRDEYDMVLSIKEMRTIITERKWKLVSDLPDKTIQGTNVERGPDGLIRHKKDARYCLGPGNDDPNSHWDRMIGYFR